MKKEVIRRSLTIPKELDERITMMADKYSYNVKNDLMIELIELGILKFDEDITLKTAVMNLIIKINELLENMENK